MRRWLLPAALLAVAPKCILCLLVYVGLGASLGLGGSELCGAPDPTTALPRVLGAMASGGFMLHRLIQRRAPDRQ